MSFEFQRVDPRSVRDEVVKFFWEQQHSWPGQTRDDYYATWDWRYSSLSDGEPIVYVWRLASTGEMVGHIGVYRRTFRVGPATLRAGVPGNLMVHPQWQNSVIGMRLVRFLRRLVESGELDAVITFSNPVADDMCVRFGFAALGSMHTYVDVHRTAPLLARRRSAAVVLSPFADLAFSARRWLRTRRHRHSAVPLDVRLLTADEFLRLDRGHWAAPDRLVSWDSSPFVVGRYLTAPRIQGLERAPTDIHGLFGGRTGSFEGYVVADGRQRIKVIDCQVNPASTSPQAAIGEVVSSLPAPESVLVSTLPQSVLARDLVGAGYLHRAVVDAVDASTFLSAYWLPASPHAAFLSDVGRWNIWVGSRHY